MGTIIELGVVKVIVGEAMDRMLSIELESRELLSKDATFRHSQILYPYIPYNKVSFFLKRE